MMTFPFGIRWQTKARLPTHLLICLCRWQPLRSFSRWGNRRRWSIGWMHKCYFVPRRKIILCSECSPVISFPPFLSRFSSTVPSEMRRTRARSWFLANIKLVAPFCGQATQLGSDRKWRWLRGRPRRRQMWSSVNDRNSKLRLPSPTRPPISLGHDSVFSPKRQSVKIQLQ
jgi:hypothetical protein